MPDKQTAGERVDIRLFKSKVEQILKQWYARDKSFEVEVGMEKECARWIAMEIYNQFNVMPKEPSHER